jgi:hypothetical protein
MKIVTSQNGKKKIKISKSEWQSIGTKAKRIRQANTEVTIWDFLEDWGKEGYGIALISPDDKVVDPYIVDGSDYPDMVLNASRDGAEVISGKYKGYYVKFHSGQFEEKVGKEWFPDNIATQPQY